jgi:hypothetical protein
MIYIFRRIKLFSWLNEPSLREELAGAYPYPRILMCCCMDDDSLEPISRNV